MTDRDVPHHHHHPVGETFEVEAEALTNPELVEMPPAEQMSLLSRVRQPRTLLSIAVPLAIIVGYVYLNRDDLADLPNLLSHLNLAMVGAAFVVYYLGFPLRGYRWATLLRGAGYKIRPRDATEVLFLSWLVNCIVPAKLGDVYRAYLLKLNSPVSATKTLGTIFIERILDLFGIAILGLAAGYWHFRDRLSTLPALVQWIFLGGVVFLVVLAIALIALRSFGARLMRRLPVPHRVVELYEKFEEGVFDSVGPRGLPLLGLLTVLIWATEGFRLWFVIQAFGLDLHMGLSAIMFVALIGSLLTAVPLTPAGVGAVEGGVGLVLTKVFGVAAAPALAIILVDRMISVLSVVVLGSIAYVVSSKTRGSGIAVEEVRPVTA